MSEKTLRRRAVGKSNATKEPVSSEKENNDPQPVSQSSEKAADVHSHVADQLHNVNSPSLDQDASDEEKLGHEDIFMRFAPTGPELLDEESDEDYSDDDVSMSPPPSDIDFTKPQKIQRFTGPIKVGLDGIDEIDNAPSVGDEDKEIFLFGVASFLASLALGFCIPVYTTWNAEGVIAIGMIILIALGLLIGFGVVKSSSPNDKSTSSSFVNYVPTKVLAGIISACVGVMMVSRMHSP